jgi:hypothetical protein
MTPLKSLAFLASLALTAQKFPAPGDPSLTAVLEHRQLPAAIESTLTLYKNDKPIFQITPEAQEIAPPQFAGAHFLFTTSHAASHTVHLLRLPAAQPVFTFTFQAEEHKIALEADTLNIEAQTYSHDPARACCEAFPFRYSLLPARPSRAQPIGFNPRQFLEAFLKAPWPEVAPLADPATRQKLQSRHAQSGPFHYGPIERCDDLARHWQVTLNNAEYFQIERLGTWHFRLRDVLAEPNPACQPDDTYPWRTSMF